MKTFLIISVLVIAVLAAGGIAFAKNKGVCGGPEGRANWMMERISKRLELDELQRGKLEDLRDALLSMREKFVDARKQGREAAADLLSVPVLDRGRAQALFDERHTAISAYSQELINAFADFSDSLNAEQRSALVEWLNKPRHHGSGPRHWHR